MDLSKKRKYASKEKENYKTQGSSQKGSS